MDALDKHADQQPTTASQTERHARADVVDVGDEDRDDLIRTLQSERARYKEQVDALQLEVRILLEKLRLLKARKYGSSSERRVDDKQLVLAFLEELKTTADPQLAERLAAEVLADLEDDGPDKETSVVGAHTRKKAGRRGLSPDLERIVQREELPEADRVCPRDGSALREIGVEVSERVHIIPAQYKVLRIERVKYACPCCDLGLKVAPLAPRLIPRSLFTDESLAWIVTGKFVDGLPLFRLAKSMKRYGGDLSPNTLAETTVRIGSEVTPMINILRDSLFERGFVNGDETWLQVLKEPGRAAQTKSFIWQMASDEGPPIRLFHYAPGRGLEHAEPIYDGIPSGTALMTDGYEVYETLAKKHGLIHLGCWSHARRYVVETEDVLPQEARQPPNDAAAALQWRPHLSTQLRQLIGALFKVEEKAAEFDPSREGVDAADAAAMAAARLERRRQLRERHSQPLLERIRDLVAENLKTYPPRSKMAEALVYLNNQWPKLIRCFDNPAWPISNNAAENAMRPVAVGRKAWLFADSVGGAVANANLFSLVETCRANDVNPYHYLVALFKRLPLCRTADDYEALLPWRIQLE